MEQNCKIVGTKMYVFLMGEVDHHYVKEIKKEMDGKLGFYIIKELILDFTNVQFMDSAGIGLIMHGYQYMKNVLGSITCVGMSQRIKKSLAAAGVFTYISEEKQEKYQEEV